MTVERRVEIIPASGQFNVAPGNIFRLITATSAVTVNVIRGGTREVFSGMLALIVRRINAWDYIQIIGTAGDSVEFFTGDEIVTEDQTDVPVTAVQITGTASVKERPTDTVSDLAPVVIADASASIVVPASTTRRRIKVQADSTSAGSVFIRTAAATNNLFELQPGVSMNFDTFDELWARNDTGAAVTVYRFEET